MSGDVSCTHHQNICCDCPVEEKQCFSYKDANLRQKKKKSPFREANQKQLIFAAQKAANRPEARGGCSYSSSVWESSAE